jgi:hypothetical protein
MKSIMKRQWTQIAAVVAAAACAVTGTVAGVSGAFSPMEAYAFAEGDKLTMTIEPNDDGDGEHFEITSPITAAEVGQKITVSMKADGFAGQNAVGAIGYADSTNGYKWVQNDWEIAVGSDDTINLEFEIKAGMVGQKVQIQSWYPTVDKITSYSAICGDAGENPVVTTTTNTPVVTTVPPIGGEEADFTVGTQEGTDGDIQAVAEFKPGNAKYAVITYKVLSNDLMSSCAVGTWHPDTEWVQVDYKNEKVDANGLVTVTYQFPEKVGTTIKAMIFSPGNKDVEFQSITLYGSQPDVTTTTTVTTKKDDPSSLEFKTYYNGDNKNINVTYMCYMVATFKSPVSGTCYYNNKSIPWTAVDKGNGYYVAEVPLDTTSGDNIMNLNISSNGSVQGNLRFYYPGDASLNGVVNGSDLRAIAKYLQASSSEKTDIMNAVCDYTRDGSVSMNDAVSLTKALVGNASVPGSK